MFTSNLSFGCAWTEWHWNWQIGLEDEASGMKFCAKHSASLFEHLMVELPFYMKKQTIFVSCVAVKKWNFS
jgi:hypothetical protein